MHKIRGERVIISWFMPNLDQPGSKPGSFSACTAFSASLIFLAIEMGRDPTPSELHLYVHTHGHDGKSFVGERSRLLHEKYEEIVREKRQSQSDIDQLKLYYQAAGGVKMKRIFGLGSKAKG